jgi:hypothetical protein
MLGNDALNRIDYMGLVCCDDFLKVSIFATSEVSRLLEEWKVLSSQMKTARQDADNGHLIMIEECFFGLVSFAGDHGAGNLAVDLVADGVQTARSSDGKGAVINSLSLATDLTQAGEGVWRARYFATAAERASTVGFATAVSFFGSAISFVSMGNAMIDAMAAEDKYKPILRKMEWREREIVAKIDERQATADRMYEAYQRCLQSGY